MVEIHSWLIYRSNFYSAIFSERPLTMLFKSNNQMSYTDLTSIHKSFLKWVNFLAVRYILAPKNKMLKVFSIH